MLLGTFAILFAGGVAGVVTWAFATPMDVVKARLQMSGAGGREYSGVLHCIRVSIREEGVRVFFKGLLLNSLRAFPVNAVTFLSYESLMKMLCPPERWRHYLCLSFWVHEDRVCVEQVKYHQAVVSHSRHIHCDLYLHTMVTLLMFIRFIWITSLCCVYQLEIQ